MLHIKNFLLRLGRGSGRWWGSRESPPLAPVRNISRCIFFIFFSCFVHSTVFFPSNIALAFLMSREKYYTHAVGQRQKYYEAEGILLVLVDKRSIAQPSILLWRKMYDITLYFRPLRSFSFAFLSLFFLRSQTRKKIRPEQRKLLLEQTYESTRKIK